jgi:hypothetical protein
MPLPAWKSTLNLVNPVMVDHATLQQGEGTHKANCPGMNPAELARISDCFFLWG